MSHENYCDTCQTLAVVCLDQSHPRSYEKQTSDFHDNDIVLEERCDICEARGCTSHNHSKNELALKAFCRNTIVERSGKASEDFDKQQDFLLNNPDFKLKKRKKLIPPKETIYETSDVPQ